jgi:hypothetical protein
VLPQSDPSRATAYLAYGLSQPARRSGWLHSWALLADVHAELDTRLGAEALGTAWEQGRAIDVNCEAASLLAELQQFV